MELLDIKCKYFLACDWCEKWNEMCHAAQQIREDQKKEKEKEHLTISKNISSAISNEYTTINECQGWDAFNRDSICALSYSGPTLGESSVATGAVLEHDIPDFLTTKVDF